MVKMNLEKFKKIVFDHERIKLDLTLIEQLKDSYSFLQDYSKDKIIYGINTGFGPMAQFKINESKLEELQYNLIRSHNAGAGNVLSPIHARSILLARLNSFLQGKSGVSTNVIHILNEFLNNDIIPEIYEHGSVGASGDLVQLSNLSLNLIGEGFVYYEGDRRKTKEILEQLNIKPLKLELRDGLGLINGTSCMLGIGLVNLIEAYEVLNWTIICSSSINELMESFDDSISYELNNAKLHIGQREISEKMRKILSDSGLMINRVDYYNKYNGIQNKFNKKIQEYYSIRCVPQILGPVLDTLNYSKEVLLNELNSTNDNPIVDKEANGVFHGGNFHGDYISLEMDKIKTVLVKITMLCERQLNFLLNPALNSKFPAFLNNGTLGLNFGLQGTQYTATSTTAESQTLAFPNYVHSIPNNNDNQDIVSMGTNSALLTHRVSNNAFQVLSIHVLAICKAIDLLNESEKSKLSTYSKMIYNDLKKYIVGIDGDKTLNNEIQEIQIYLRSKKIKL